jgi:hypothetical protein
MKIYKIIRNIKKKLENENYKGWDVFDGLNSKLFKRSFFFESRLCRLFWIQLFKLSPINLRKVTKVRKGHNAKGLSLFIQGYLSLYRIDSNQKILEKSYRLARIILSQKAKNRDYFCVGYNFHWEARAFTVPIFTPNMIVSSFVGQSFLDLYEIDGNQKWLKLTKEIGIFIERELKLFENNNKLCFGYIPGKKVRIHNANLMGARLYARLYSITGLPKYKKYAIKAARYTLDSQDKKGAWVYGERNHHQWVDNFHTGFNLVALKDIQEYLNINSWNDKIQKGIEYHINNHFLDDMTPKYYDNKIFPIDIHNYAQGIDTFLSFDYLNKAEKLLNKCLDEMWDQNRHYFYYQKNRFYTNKINYIRWSQAWMFYALTRYYNKIM